MDYVEARPLYLLRRMDSNHRPQGYGPCELPTAPRRDIKNLKKIDKRQTFLKMWDLNPRTYKPILYAVTNSANFRSNFYRDY